MVTPKSELRDFDSNTPDLPQADVQLGSQTDVYEGQFGQFTITAADRLEVKVYRSGLLVAALSFAIATALVLWQPQALSVQWAIAILYALFSLALGVSLQTIHIYMSVLHRTLQVFWAIGSVAAIVVAVLASPTPLAIAVYEHPLMLMGVGFTFAALTGVFVKEAFCFNRLETKLLTPLLPALLLGHMLGLWPIAIQQWMLVSWAALFLLFAVRKIVQPIPPDIGDKSVFDYLAAVRRGEIAIDTE